MNCVFGVTVCIELCALLWFTGPLPEIPLEQDIRPEDLSLAASGLTELCSFCVPSADVKIEESTNSVEEMDHKPPVQEIKTCDPSKVNSIEKEETSSITSDEEDVSDLEIAECGLEPGEIPSMLNNGKLVSEKTNLCVRTYNFLVFILSPIEKPLANLEQYKW